VPLPYLRAIKTGQCAFLTSESETLPIKALLTLPSPLPPIAIRSTSSSSAKTTTSSSALPNLLGTVGSQEDLGGEDDRLPAHHHHWAISLPHDGIGDTAH
jgi:hypothetical protein